MNLSEQQIFVSLPVAPLRPYISHYWLSLNNKDKSYAITPDGVVDVVVVIGSATSRLDAFGTTTTRAEVQLELGKHYLGIRFKPGQSRHFLDAKASELTNAVCTADGAFLPGMPELTGLIFDTSLFARLDVVLLQHLKQRPPGYCRIDDVLSYIDTTQGSLQVSELIGIFCKSRRQFERTFLDTVGVPPKLFTEIIRCQRAAALLANPELSLAGIAAVMGYTDQSHFTHEFVRFHGQPPSRARQDAAFLQDLDRLTRNNADTFHLY